MKSNVVQQFIELLYKKKIQNLKNMIINYSHKIKQKDMPKFALIKGNFTNMLFLLIN